MNRTPLRRDLQVLPLNGERDCVVVDDIGGRFARIKSAVWEKLQSANRQRDAVSETDSVWQQATQAGWTESRVGNSQSRAWSPLSIRIPVGSIDPLARRVLPVSGLLFAPRAIVFWMLAAWIGLVMLIVRWEYWSGSIPSLAVYLQSLQPLSIGLIFVLTKSVHELGHALACRRLGVRCGVAGVWFLCFMPCPYVDVTEVWRQPDPMRRAFVMAAGMIAEGVLCVIAIWVWAWAGSAEVRLAAMNLILICGVSTVLFNANPLMRYDGYFILSDLVDSTNLREEARRAWARLLIEPVSRWLHLGRRTWSMLFYHGAATVYRVMLVIAIATMLLRMADRIGAWRIAATVVLLIALRIVLAKCKGGVAMWIGEGKWASVRSFRRRGLALLTCGGIVAMLSIPTPRYRHVQGRLRAADTHSVYLPTEGIIREVNVRVGDRVSRKQCLARLSAPELLLEIESSAGRAGVLKHRARSARLASLQTHHRNDSSSKRGPRITGSPTAAPEPQWEVLEAASRSLATRQAELAQRRAQLTVVSPAEGVVLPSDQEIPDDSVAHGDPNELTPGVGLPPDDRFAWCRVATTSRVHLSLALSASDHRDAGVGCPVRFTIPGYSEGYYRSRVVSVSPLRSNSPPEPGSSGLPRRSAQSTGAHHVYQAVCEVPSSVELSLDSLPHWDGARCDCVVHLPHRTLWADLREIVGEVLGI